MIGFLRGRIIERQPTRIILDVQGVGYEVFIPVSTYDRLQPGEEPVSVLTYLHVREDILQLYGFASPEEKSLFLKLISVSGIGPRVALGILSSSTVDEFCEHIATANLARLKALPGIGKKTAERLVIELKDKLAPVAGSGSVTQVMPKTDSAEDAVAALVSLGYSRQNVELVISKILRDGGAADVESLIKVALRQL